MHTCSMHESQLPSPTQPAAASRRRLTLCGNRIYVVWSDRHDVHLRGIFCGGSKMLGMIIPRVSQTCVCVWDHVTYVLNSHFCQLSEAASLTFQEP